MALWKEKVSVRELLRLIGMMSATALVVLPALLHYRELQEQNIRQLKVAQSFEAMVPLKRISVAEMQWWITMLRKWNGQLIFPLLSDIVIETDASLLCWGAAMNGISTGAFGHNKKEFTT